MVEFPQSAYFGKRIPFALLKKQGAPACFSVWIKSLVWAYKLSPDTVHLAATDTVKEIEVMDLTLKEACRTVRALASVIATIDRLIPNPIIFRVFDEDGVPQKIVFNLKTSGGTLHGESDVYRLFLTERRVALPSGVTDLESLFRNFAASVAGMKTMPCETLYELDTRHYRAESLRADLADLVKKLARETQLDRKYALAKERQRIEHEIRRIAP